jgi:hypothetical protein
MYKIIGADGKEYGPVSVEQLRQWIAEGRAKRDSRAQAEGTTDWKLLSEFPELADALAAQAPPPRFQRVQADDLARQVIESGRWVDIGACFGRAWNLLKDDFWPMVGVTLLIMVIAIASNSLYVGLILNGPLLGGLYGYYLKRIRGQRADLGDAFAGFSESFLHLMLVSLVSTLLTWVGLLLCVVPGIYLGVAWVFAVPLVMDKKLEFWDAMEVSRKVVTSQWWIVFALLLLASLLNIGGALACGIGLAVTLPITLLALIYAYEDLFAGHSATGA